jgi:enediyne biosynthesis protein E4
VQLFLGKVSNGFRFFTSLPLLLASAVAQQPSAAPSVNFVDQAPKAGIDMTVVFGGKESKRYIIETTGTGAAIFDYDNDGWPDIFIVNGTTLEASPGKAPLSRLFRNNHDGKFTDVTGKAKLSLSGWGQGVCVGDYDNDGWQDLFVTFYGTNHLLHNKGDGTFEDVSKKAGVSGRENRWGTGCAFVDYDRDGMLDLVVANYVDFDVSKAPKPGEGATCMWKGAPVMCGPRGLPGDKNILYHNRGNGTFEDASVKSGFDKTPGHYCFSVSTLDFDVDGWPDIYIACDSTPSILYRNNQDGTFTDVAVVKGVAFNEDGREQAGMGTTVGDYDGDGLLDIFRTNFSDDTSTLYRNSGDTTFVDATFAAGLGLHTKYLGWGTMFIDVDNDSQLDLISVNGHVYPEVEKYKLGSEYREPRLLFRNTGNGKFVDITESAGSGFQIRESGRGLAVGDLWNDGRMSAVITNMHAPVSLLVNEAPSKNHWIAFKTVGTKSNRDGIGARVTARVGERNFVDEVRSGSSYMSNNDMRIHFGLGAATKVDWVEVRWPSGLLERFEVLEIDKIRALKEGSGVAQKASGRLAAK